MSSHPRVRSVLACLGSLLIFGCYSVPFDPADDLDDGPSMSVVEAESIPYIVVLAGGQEPNVEKPSPFRRDDLSAVSRRLRAMSASLTGGIPEVGALLVTSTDPDFIAAAERVRGVLGVVPDLPVEGFDGSDVRLTELDVDGAALPPNTGDDDFLLDFQWGHAAIDAFGAWDTGHRGSGARVAILDSGIDAEHPDLAPNLNAALSRSFVPGEDWNVRDEVFFSHGTHVAGTVAAADNGFGVIGVAPEAEIVAIKVLSEFTTQGSFSGIAQGIVYAGDINADVANLSLRGYAFPGIFDRFAPGVSRFFASFQVLFNRATAYAHNRGTTIVVAAGNEEVDADKDRSQKILPSMSPHVITVAATAPEGWAFDFDTDLDLPASYTNFGRSLIDVAAPGGDFDLPSTELCVVSISAPRPCWVYDGVLSTVSQTWAWATGTSMATPHVAGVAALVVGANGGSMAPADVWATLRRTVDDLGDPGTDPYFGQGRVNAGSAVR